MLKPRFQVYREFHPSTVETAATTTVRLAVARTGAGSGQALMEEQLPARFGESPAFRFPGAGRRTGTSRYEYHLRSGQRGQFRIGPVTAEFSDPFGLSAAPPRDRRRRHPHGDAGRRRTAGDRASPAPAGTTASPRPGSAPTRATTTS